MKPRQTGPYGASPLVRRPTVLWPNGNRVVLWVIPNIEHFALDETITGEAAPDVAAFAARDYGNRIGVFRLMQVLDRYGIRGTAALNANVCQHHPEIIAEGNARGWEWMGHNETNTRRLDLMTPDDEAATIRRTVETIEAATGQRPTGWLSSGLRETWHTLDHLAANGIGYVGDWVIDDQPVPMTLDTGASLFALPYSTEINDKPAFERRNMTAPDFDAMIRRQFDTLWREGETQGRVMAIALHPYIIGQPHRIGALDAALEHICRHEGVWCATGAEIIAAWRSIAP